MLRLKSIAHTIISSRCLVKFIIIKIIINVCPVPLVESEFDSRLSFHTQHLSRAMMSVVSSSVCCCCAGQTRDGNFPHSRARESTDRWYICVYVHMQLIQFNYVRSICGRLLKVLEWGLQATLWLTSHSMWLFCARVQTSIRFDVRLMILNFN